MTDNRSPLGPLATGSNEHLPVEEHRLSRFNERQQIASGGYACKSRRR